MLSKKYNVEFSAAHLALLSAIGGGFIVVGVFGILQHIQNVKKQQLLDEDEQYLIKSTNYNNFTNKNVNTSAPINITKINNIKNDNNNKSNEDVDLKSLPTLKRSSSTTQMGKLGFLKRQSSLFDFEKELAQLPLESQLELLRERHNQLTNLLSIAEDTNYRVQHDTLTPNDIETLRAFFNSVDKDQDGKVTQEEFDELNRRLGEPLTIEETKTAIFGNKILNPDNSQQISFSNFLGWWQVSHAGNKKGKQYAEKFKFAREKVQGNFDIDNVRIQPVENKGTAEFRIFFSYKTSSGSIKRISPWHDIPLFHLNSEHKTIYNFICEVPKWTRAKYEIATGEEMNPIHQDIINGKLRYYLHGDMMFNYGALPQTWEDPEHIDPTTNCPGDNDPLDCIEFGTKQLPTGSITPVKVLGLLGLLDGNETDWKILAISIHDPLANQLQDIDDFDKEIPGAIEAIREYLRIYKVAQGKSENRFAFRGEALNKEFACKIIQQCHDHWKGLTAKKTNESTIHNLSVSNLKTPETNNEKNHDNTNNENKNK